MHINCGQKKAAQGRLCLLWTEARMESLFVALGCVVIEPTNPPTAVFGLKEYARLIDSGETVVSPVITSSAAATRPPSCKPSRFPAHNRAASAATPAPFHSNPSSPLPFPNTPPHHPA